METTKTRLDLVLVQKGIADSRQRAQALIMAGKIIVNDKPIDKPGTRISEADPIVVRGDDIPDPGVPESFNVLVKELQSLGLQVDLFKANKEQIGE